MLKKGGIMIKTIVLISLSLLLGGTAFFLNEVVLEKISKTILIILLFLVFMLTLFVGVILIYRLGKFWNLETHTKIILGVVCNVTILAIILCEHMKR